MKYLLIPLLVLLSACSFAPIPINVNLLEEGFAGSSGSFSLSTPSSKVDLSSNLPSNKAGTLGPFSSPVATSININQLANFFDLNLPNRNGFAINFQDKSVPAQLNAASLSYTLELAKTGPVTVDLILQAYLAPNNGEALKQDKFKLGDATNLDFSEESVSQTITLNEQQLAGINQKALRLVIAIEGGTLSFSEANVDASLSYNLSSLELDVGEVSTSVRQLVPDAEGLSFDFSNQDLPAIGRISTLGFDYTIKLDIEGDLNGTVASQLYIAPDTTTDLTNEIYAFGDPQNIDLSQESTLITDRAKLNREQLKLLDTKKARAVIVITGEPNLALGQTITINYQFQKLELFGGYSLN